jgi:hypothetical protein
MVITLTVFGAYFYMKDVMNMEAPGVNFINILQAAFAPTVLRQ